LSLESFAWLEICKPSKLSSADGGKTLEICGGKRVQGDVEANLSDRIYRINKVK
jgi:hypothetical protein